MTTSVAGPRPALVVTVLSSVGLVASLSMTLVLPIVPQLPALLDTTTATASWVITATLLAGAVATPITGRLGDMVGKRRVLLITMGSLVVGSVLCATTSSLVPVLVGRALQGVAISAIPLGISLMRDALPPAWLGSGIALMSATLGIGGGLGLPLSAVVVQTADWHALFWAAGALALAGSLLILAVIPETSVRDGGRFDAVGAVGLSIALVCLLLAISKGGEWGFDSPLTMSLFAAAAVVGVAWGAYELRVREPLVDLRVTARRAVLLPNLISVPVGVAMFTGMVVYPQLLTAPATTGIGLGLSLLTAGLVLAPNGVVMMMTSPLTARLSAAAGPRTSLQLGLVLVIVAYGAGTVLLSAWWHVALVISLVGAGTALAYGSLPALIMRAVSTHQTAAANGVNTLMRALGTSTASAVVAVVLSASMVDVGGATVPSPTGLRVTLLIAAGCALVALLASFAVPRLPLRDEEPVREVTDVGHSGAWVHGRVALAGGDPAGGGRVTVVGLDGRQLGVAAVGDDGRFHVDRDPLTQGSPGPGHHTGSTVVLLVAGHPRGAPRAVHALAGEGSEARSLVLAAPSGGAEACRRPRCRNRHYCGTIDGCPRVTPSSWPGSGSTTRWPAACCAAASSVIPA